MTKAHLAKVIGMRDHEIAGLKRRIKAYEEADTIDQFKAAVGRAREAEELLAQARKRDTMLDDMCNLIEERDALKAQLEELKAKKGSIHISEDYTVWGSSDSINRLSDHLDDLESQIESLKASELAHRLLYEHTKEQNALLVEALEYISVARYKYNASHSDIAFEATRALAAIKEADKQGE